MKKNNLKLTWILSKMQKLKIKIYTRIHFSQILIYIYKQNIKYRLYKKIKTWKRSFC